jgi:outer membrane protein assembly factor BamB
MARRSFVMAVCAVLTAAYSFAGRAQDNVESTAPPAEMTAKPPFRLGYLQLNPTIDQEKPLAASDAAGFVLNSGVLIGAFDKHWVGGLSMDTRRMLWWFNGGADLTAPPGSFGSSVVLGFRDGKIAKLDALTGNKQWTVTIDSFSERSFLLNGTTLYVLSAAQVLHALDFQTGRTLWLFDGGFPEGLAIRGGARPIVHDNKILFGIASGEILAVQAETGKPVWRYNPAYNDQRFHDVVGEIVVRNNKLILSRYDGLVAAIDLASSVRTLAWQQQLPGLSSSAFRNGRFYVGGLNGDVYAIDPDTGRKVWRTITGKPVNTLTAGETQLFVGGAEGRVTALDASNGHVLWHDELGTAVASAPILVEDAIYYATGMKGIYAYKLR